MGEQNDNRESLFKIITEEIEGFNTFFTEMCVKMGDTWTTDFIVPLYEDLLESVHKSVLEAETESGLTMDDIMSLISSLNDLHDSILDSESEMDSSTKANILAKRKDIIHTIIRSSIEGKVKEMKHRIEKAAAKNRDI